MTTTLDKPEVKNIEFELEAHGVSFKLTITPVANNSPTPTESEFPPDRLKLISDRVAETGLGIFKHPVSPNTPDLYASIPRHAPMGAGLPSASQQNKIDKILAKKDAAPVQSKTVKKKTLKRKAKKKAARKKK